MTGPNAASSPIHHTSTVATGRPRLARHRSWLLWLPLIFVVVPVLVGMVGLVGPADSPVTRTLVLIATSGPMTALTVLVLPVASVVLVWRYQPAAWFARVAVVLGAIDSVGIWFAWRGMTGAESRAQDLVAGASALAFYAFTLLQLAALGIALARHLSGNARVSPVPPTGGVPPTVGPMG